MADAPTNPLKSAILGGQARVGGWCLSGSPDVVEALGCQPYDYLVIDLEHSPTPPHGVAGLLRAAAAAAIPVMVRLPNHDPSMIKTVLDLGATNLLVPFVDTVAEAEALVRAVHYPPRGRRGYAAMHRAGRYLATADYARHAGDGLMLIAQLESPAALERATDIAALPGIDALFIGPGDLSIAMGLPGQAGAAPVRAAMSACVARLKAVGAAVGTVCPNADAAAAAFADGFGFVSVANDLALMVTGARRDLTELRRTVGLEPSR